MAAAKINDQPGRRTVQVGKDELIVRCKVFRFEAGPAPLHALLPLVKQLAWPTWRPSGGQRRPVFTDCGASARKAALKRSRFDAVFSALGTYSGF